MHRIIAALVAAALSGPASAAIIFHTTPGAFNTAVSGLVGLGGEDFESSTLAPNNIVSFDDPLAPGAANSVFPTGTNPAIGMTVQSNTHVDNGATTNPRGPNALATASAGFLGTPDDQISTNEVADSLDLIFASPVLEPIVAVGLRPLYFDSNSINASGSILVQVFDTSNSLLDSITIANVEYQNETAFIGIEATGSDDIGRINLFDGVASLHFQGADDITVFAAQPPAPAPAPATLALLALGLIAVGARVRRA